MVTSKTWHGGATKGESLLERLGFKEEKKLGQVANKGTYLQESQDFAHF